MGLKHGDLSGLDLRRDLPMVLSTLAELADPQPLLDALAAADPIALAEVVCGPRAPGGPHIIRAALRHANLLERRLTARGAYGRLAELAGPAAPEVLAAAVQAHGAPAWVWALSKKIEREAVGEVVLREMAESPLLPEACRAAVAAGARESLVRLAATGTVEPALALLFVDRMAAVRAAAAAIEVDLGQHVVPALAGAWGPEPDELFVRIVPHLRTRAAARAFAAMCTSCVQTQRLVRAVAASLPVA